MCICVHTAAVHKHTHGRAHTHTHTDIYQCTGGVVVLSVQRTGTQKADKDGDERTEWEREGEKPDEPLEANWRILLHRLKQTGGGCLTGTDKMGVNNREGDTHTRTEETHLCRANTSTRTHSLREAQDVLFWLKQQTTAAAQSLADRTEDTEVTTSAFQPMES